jgi:hypothetical protein
MNKYATGTFGAAVLLVAATIGAASPAGAAPSWEMPDVEGMILQEAWDEVVSTTEGLVAPETATENGSPLEQINLTNWVVCSQSPAAGDEILAEEPPELEVARPSRCE